MDGCPQIEDTLYVFSEKNTETEPGKTVKKEKKKDGRNDQEQKRQNADAAGLTGAMGDLNGNMSRGRRTGRHAKQNTMVKWEKGKLKAQNLTK